MAKNSVRLQLRGMDCVVRSDDSEAYVREVAAEVEACMNALAAANPHASDTVTAMVTALSYCDDCRKARQETAQLRAQIKAYLEDSSRARLEAEEAQKEILRLKKEVAALRARLGAQVPPAAPAQEEPHSPFESSYTRPAEEAGQEDFLHYFTTGVPAQEAPVPAPDSATPAAADAPVLAQAAPAQGQRS